jgi:ribosome biogenesis GTPase
MSKKRKIRADFRKNRETPARQKDHSHHLDDDATGSGENVRAQRLTGKGELTRRRTLADAEIVEDDSGTLVLPAIDRERCQLGWVLRGQGLHNFVQDDQGKIYRCATRRILKTLQTAQRHVVAAGDRVWFRPEGADEGIIERVEPRHGVISRTSRGRQHVLVANVDQMMIITSAAEPRIKPNLIDRLIVTAEKCHIQPVICINKIDLVDPAELQPLVGVYSQLGYHVLLLSTIDGLGVDSLRQWLRDKRSVLTGQSGVGKSSLLNAVEPGLKLRVQSVSEDTEKGKHTTTTAELLPLEIGGFVIDTPGIRQFQLWDVIPEEVAEFFREMRPFVSKCRFPNCSHTHEDECAVKEAVAFGWIDDRRYDSYVQIQAGDED